MNDFKGAIRLALKGSIASITLDNPQKHNSLSAEDIEMFLSHLEYLEARPEIRVLVITGNGPKTFCAGVSLVELTSDGAIADLFQELTDKLANMKIPTLCAMNGSAFGGGAELSLCCDFRIGVKGMAVQIPAARFGLCYPINGIRRYVQRLGINTAKKLLMAAEKLDAETLLAEQYLTHLVEPAELAETAAQMAENLSQLAPLAVTGMKQICDQMVEGNLSTEELNQDAQTIVQNCRQSKDLLEGLNAMRERRQPKFTGEIRSEDEKPEDQWPLPQ